MYLSVESGVGEALAAPGGVSGSTHRQLVLALRGIDKVVGSVPGGSSQLSRQARQDRGEGKGGGGNKTWRNKLTKTTLLSAHATR